MYIHFVKLNEERIQIIADSKQMGAVTRKITININELYHTVNELFQRIIEINNLSKSRIKDTHRNNQDLYDQLINIGEQLRFSIFKDLDIWQMNPDDESIVFSLDEDLLFLPLELFSKDESLFCMKKMSKQIKAESIETVINLKKTKDKLRAIILSNPDMDMHLEPVMKKEREEIYEILKQFTDVDRPIIGKQITRDFLMDNLWRYHIIYFSGHSVINPMEPDAVGLRLAKNNFFTPDLISRIDFSHCELFYINSCESLSPQGGIHGKNLIGPLLKAGVNNVIGNTLPVSNHNAYHFGSRFFNEMKSGLSISEAILETREASFSSWLNIEQEMNDLTWLNVSFFGNPDWRLPGTTKKYDNKQNNTRDISKLVSLIGHKGAVGCIDYSSDGNYLVSASDDTSLKLWDLKTGKCIHTFKEHKGAVNCVSFSPKNDLIVSGSNDGTIRFWDFQNFQHIKALKNYSKSSNIRSISFSEDGKYFVYNDMDENEFGQYHKVVLISTELQRPKHHSIIPEEYYIDDITAIRFSPIEDNHQYQLETAIAGNIRFKNYQCILLWQPRQKLYRSILLNKNIEKLYSIKYSKFRKFLAAGGANTKILLYSGITHNPIEFDYSAGHLSGKILSIDFSPDEKYMATSDNYGYIIIWDMQTLKKHREFLVQNNNNTMQKNHKNNELYNRVSCVRFSPCGKYVAAGCDDGIIRIFGEHYEDFD